MSEASPLLQVFKQVVSFPSTGPVPHHAAGSAQQPLLWLREPSATAINYTGIYPNPALNFCWGTFAPRVGNRAPLCCCKEGGSAGKPPSCCRRAVSTCPPSTGSVQAHVAFGLAPAQAAPAKLWHCPCPCPPPRHAWHLGARPPLQAGHHSALLASPSHTHTLPFFIFEIQQLHLEVEYKYRGQAEARALPPRSDPLPPPASPPEEDPRV